MSPIKLPRCFSSDIDLGEVDAALPSAGWLSAQQILERVSQARAEGLSPLAFLPTHRSRIQDILEGMMGRGEAESKVFSGMEMEIQRMGGGQSIQEGVNYSYFLYFVKIWAFPFPST